MDNSKQDIKKIWQEFTQLEGSVQVLHIELDSLTERINPILALIPPSPEKQCEEIKDYSPPRISEKIALINAEVRKACRIIVELQERAEC